MTDCLIIGFNDGNLQDYLKMLKSMGEKSGAYKDLDLAVIYHDGNPYRATDILNHFHWKERGLSGRPFHNADFLWPVITNLGTYLHKREIAVDYINLFHLEKQKLKDKLLKDEILSIAITTTLYVSAEPIFEIISFIRQYNRSAKIIVGGPFISNQAKSDKTLLDGLFTAIGADFYVISSEGEATLAELISALKNGVPLETISNLSYRNGNEYIFNPQMMESNALEENMVDYSLFPRAEIGQFVTTRTAKSCPFSCAFCGFPQRAGQYTYMSVAAVERELNALRELGTVTTVTFIDDTFNVPKARFKEILRMMIRNRYEFKWNCLYRSDHGDEEAIELMGKAACEGVFLGVESGSDLMLQKMNKSARRKDYLRAIPLLTNAGVSTYASLIIGFPGETYDTVQETISLIEEAKPEYFRAQLWYCDPVTPIWNKREEYGIRGSGFQWSHQSMDVNTACALIDRLFLCVEGSIWLPQFGFEQWSTFYLQRRGMSVEQIHRFLRSFNEIIKERILKPQTARARPELMERLKECCIFDRPAALNGAETFSAGAYKAAESFWLHEFSQCSPSMLGRIQDRAFTSELQWRSIRLDGLEKLPGRSADFEVFESMVAAFCVFISRCTGLNDISLLSARLDADGRRILPLRILLADDSSYESAIGDIRRKAAISEQYASYGWYILSSPTIMELGKTQCPEFDAAYMHIQAGGEILDDVLSSVPEMCNVSLMLATRPSDDGIDSFLVCQSCHFSEPLSRKLGNEFVGLCQELFASPRRSIAEFGPEKAGSPAIKGAELSREQSFSFERE